MWYIYIYIYKKYNKNVVRTNSPSLFLHSGWSDMGSPH